MSAFTTGELLKCKMKKKLSEKEIDKVVIAQADDETDWIKPQIVKNRTKRGSREKVLEALNKLKAKSGKTVELIKN